MDWITEKIAIGNYVDATEPDLLRQNAIRAILCLDWKIFARAIEGIAREVVHLNDEPGNSRDDFLRAVTTLERLVASSSPVLVHCHAGRSRSVIVVAAYLMRAQGHSAEDAIALIARKREISITPGVEQLLFLI